MASFLKPLAAVVPLVAASGAPAAEIFAGPVEAAVIQVLDGDTFLAEAHVWPGHSIRINVRVRGIDAPEMRARCLEEHEAAQRARQRLAGLFGTRRVSISNIAGAKYYGRVLADVTTADGASVAEAMLTARLVRSYTGGRRAGWCS